MNISHVTLTNDEDREHEKITLLNEPETDLNEDKVDVMSVLYKFWENNVFVWKLERKIAVSKLILCFAY